ncbi:BirA family transcriptional regulator, biotin operon repressor / biotin-(acetyl-CoA-carboxylase) ligase [Burkholderiales bacterium 8X]|nr:BirA family transcriptional regulator, biotin operon repressor / biotin-(acetyl-CoA-carboxylase) ligase [Burkholderiales bacterium 8X]
MAAPWFEDEIRAACGDVQPGLQVEIADELDSTSSELMRRARDGRLQPTVLVARRQTAGRGRVGRAWHSGSADDASSLTFSIGLSMAPRDWSGLSLAAGVSVAESIDPAKAIGLSLKWPNDLWVRDRKLGGILIETASPQPRQEGRYLIVGIGINLGPREAADLRTSPAWLHEWRPDVSPGELLRTLAVPLLHDLQLFGARGFAAFADRYAERDALLGREVELSDGSRGVCEGVAWGGELLLRTPQGLKEVASGELSVRPRKELPS